MNSTCMEDSSHSEKALLENILNNPEIDEINQTFSDELIQLIYKECCEKQDVYKAYRLYKLIHKGPDDSLKNKGVTANTIVQFSFIVDYHSPTRVDAYNVGNINLILKTYHPFVFFHKTISDFSEMHNNHPDNISSAADLFKIIQSYYALKPGYQHRWEIPIKQPLNIIGQYIGDPFITTDFEAAIPKPLKERKSFM